MLVVFTLTLAPTLIAVDMLAVAGSLAVFSVPELMLLAFDEYVVAFEYALSARLDE